ncbi:NADP transhydrogenase subunit alpha [Frankia sp. CcI156]|uniref:NAD(P)/FAD-dependent oxidoreductase n=1 Tax=Frankia TaxID=1854 RepID=UPI0003098C60|nr:MULTISPECIES: FAD-dependent oxidoreductase [Frankia]ETA02652.1 putative NAD/FAD-dependent oxidoreductase [Frankia sp. CcI6]EYT93039.1 putative NAD/FAD-dependent oxidoreductase [Frankia casuarinae]KDA44137.1 putative NAD/FAD-dependent oxidoreductase [Frankia sp. BMG5.23]OHV49529.1 NADP transhydrogenase subunit alpha [Frankia sp. CgIS1]ONH29434.1 NADP transhydrogenase subunit alpha [Frankia sp. CcI156]
MAKVVVAGGGIAGIACASALLAEGITVDVRDRGRVIGGRMASRWIDGRIVDSGASYFTATSPEFREVVDDWFIRGLVRPWTHRMSVISGPTATLAEPRSGPLRYAAPRGLRSLVADLASRAGVQVTQSTPIRRVTPGPRVDDEAADAVVLAMPDPQALRHLDPACTEERAQLAGRPWSPVLALLAGWPYRCWAPIDGAFVHDDDTIAWIADDGRRRGDNAAVLVAHSTPDFARPRLADPAAAGPDLVAALRRLLTITMQPSWTYVQKWTFARPDRPHEQPYYLSSSGIGLAGDGWGTPKIESAWRSGTELGRALAARLR